jgi:GTPase
MGVGDFGELSPFPAAGGQMTEDHRFGHVALLGPTNAGKSTLLNRIIGQKVSIVSPKPQTTRNRISGIYTREDAQIVFLDTPGLHDNKRGISPLLMRSAWNSLAQADLILLVLDADLYAKKPGQLEHDLRPLLKGASNSPAPVLAALNKVDKVKEKERLLPIMERLAEAWPTAEFFPLSAKQGKGVDALLETVRDKLPLGPPFYTEEEISTAPIRFMASEIIREKLYMALGQELPYSTAVMVENWDETSRPGMTVIDAVIYVARDSHKGIVIGKRGERLKKIGSEARLEIEELIDGRVFLELWVKVRRDWTGDEIFIRSLGIGD